MKLVCLLLGHRWWRGAPDGPCVRCDASQPLRKGSGDKPSTPRPSFPSRETVARQREILGEIGASDLSRSIAEKVEREAPFPHCDQRILHAPGDCKYCDCYPAAQKLRDAWGIAFTGQKPRPGCLPCPADHARGNKHKQWPGNRARPHRRKKEI